MKNTALTLKHMAARLQALEVEVAELRRQLAAQSPKINDRWWETEAGRFKDDPTFEEAVRFGRQYRKSLDRKPRTKTKAKR